MNTIRGKREYKSSNVPSSIADVQFHYDYLGADTLFVNNGSFGLTTPAISVDSTTNVSSSSVNIGPIYIKNGLFREYKFQVSISPTAAKQTTTMKIVVPDKTFITDTMIGLVRGYQKTPNTPLEQTYAYVDEGDGNVVVSFTASGTSAHIISVCLTYRV